MASIGFIDPSSIPFVSTFLFVFALVFGLLTYSRVFTHKEDKPDRKINGAIALAIAFFSMLYEPLVTGLVQYMPIAIGIMIILFFIVFVKKILEGKEGKNIDTIPLLVALVIFCMLAYLFEGQIRLMLPTGINPDAFIWMAGIAATIIFFWLVYKVKE